jgi:hypothetical protein
MQLQTMFESASFFLCLEPGQKAIEKEASSPVPQCWPYKL